MPANLLLIFKMFLGACLQTPRLSILHMLRVLCTHINFEVYSYTATTYTHSNITATYVATLSNLCIQASELHLLVVSYLWKPHYKNPGYVPEYDFE